jgi:hypothetical protein
MSAKQIISSIAIVGSVATFAVLNSGSSSTQTTFLQEGAHNEVDLAFQNYLSKFGRNFGTKEEYTFRQQIFSANYHKVMSHNMQNKNGHSLEMNKFADMTPAEFK